MKKKNLRIATLLVSSIFNLGIVSANVTSEVIEHENCQVRLGVSQGYGKTAEDTNNDIQFQLKEYLETKGWIVKTKSFLDLKNLFMGYTKDDSLIPAEGTFLFFVETELKWVPMFFGDDSKAYLSKLYFDFYQISHDFPYSNVIASDKEIDLPKKRDWTKIAESSLKKLNLEDIPSCKIISAN